MNANNPYLNIVISAFVIGEKDSPVILPLPEKFSAAWGKLIIGVRNSSRVDLIWWNVTRESG